MFPRPPPLTRGLLIALGVLFVGQLVAAAILGFDSVAYERWVADILHLSPEGLTRGYVWQLFTHMWLHSVDGIGHVLFNCVALYFFGVGLEPLLGRRSMLRLYLVAGFVGGLLWLAVAWSAVALDWRSASVGVVGASGAIRGVVAAYCWSNRDRWLNIFITRLRGWHLLVLLVVLDVLRVLAQEPIAIAGHLGGMLVGIAWVDRRGPKRWWLKWKKRRVEKKLHRFKVVEGGRSDDGRTLH